MPLELCRMDPLRPDDDDDDEQYGNLNTSVTEVNPGDAHAPPSIRITVRIARLQSHGEVRFAQAVPDKFGAVQVNVLEKQIQVSCGSGTQRLKWLGHVGIARYDEENLQGWKTLGKCYEDRVTTLSSVTCGQSAM